MTDSGHIGKYAVDRRLGTGGMAEVFKCHLQGIGGFDKTLVVKRILPHLAQDDEFVAMFLDEARIAANLNHPNIVQVYEIGQDDEGAPYIAMEFVRGPTFAQVIRAACKVGDLKLPLLARIVQKAAQGLDAAHRARGPSGEPLNIVHRDVSPHNIMVSTDGVPKVLDFGVARADGRLTHTRSGAVKGKARFMAPELLTNPDGPIDARVDVFSLGVCLYVSTVGTWPFNGNSDSAIMEVITKGEYKAPTAINPQFPKELEDIIAWALQKDPSRRCADARALAERLGDWVTSTGAVSDHDVSSWVSSLFPDIDSEQWTNAGPQNTPTGLRGSPSGVRGTPSGLLRGGQATAQREGSGSKPGLRPPPTGNKVSGAHLAVQRVTGGQGITPSGSFHPRAAQAALLAPRAQPGRTRKALTVVLALLLLAGLGFLMLRPAQPSPELQAAPFVEEAKKAMANGKLSLAREMIERARAVPGLPARQTIELATMADAVRAAEDAARKPDEALARLEAAKTPEKTVEAPVPEPVANPQPQATPRAARRAPAVNEQAPLDLTSTPSGAQVFVDGRLAGTTPLVKFMLAAGPHALALSKDGFRRHDETITATGGPLSISVALEAAGPDPARVAQLKVSSNVPATVTMDGVRLGVTPLESSGLPPGRHVLLFVAEGHDQVTREVELLGGQLRALEVDLPVTKPVSATTPPPPVDPGLGECPEGAAWTGQAPPAGSAAWCAGAGGVRQGKFVRWFPNGRKAEEGDYLNGKKNGLWLEYFADGTERERVTWRRGVKTW